MMIGNPNNMVKDRHPLWRNFNKNNYERPFNDGVVGPQWEMNAQEVRTPYNHIASPMPRPVSVRRILPNDLPPVTYSASSFDMPLRKNVVQIDIPNATIRTTEENIDPRFPPKKAVATVSGTLYHGTGSVDSNIIHGLPSFMQKKMKKYHSRHNQNKIDTNLIKSEALTHARNAEIKATEMLNSIVNNTTPHMILKVNLANRYEQPELKLHEHNPTLHRIIAEHRNTPAGVRASHTFRRLE